MHIASARLRNFRCFTSLDLEFERPIVLIHGPNGCGKTSILEALHYACYLKSFKTHLPKDIVRSEASGFGVGLSVASQSFDTLHVEFLNKKKNVKLNERGINSYQELYEAYRAVTIHEDDLQMVQGSPSSRRSFLDMMVLLHDPAHGNLSKKYRTILDNRNALISRGRTDHESYLLWTDQLLLVSKKIQQARIEAVTLLEREAQELIKEIIPKESMGTTPLSLRYSYARSCSEIDHINSAQELLERYPQLYDNELRQRRSLLGAHLDDMEITFLGRPCKSFSSRGQQKLVVFLLKLAQMKSMQSKGLSGTVLLVDDFMTDFDETRAVALLPLMRQLSSQLILTAPIAGHINTLIEKSLSIEEMQSIDLAHFGEVSRT